VAFFLLADAAVTVLEILVRAPDLVNGGPLLDPADTASWLLAALAALKVIAAVGLWRGSWRAWVLTMLLVGVSLLALILLSLSGTEDPRYLRLAINVVIAFYLNQGLVRDYFEPSDEAGPGQAGVSR
jgi:hypothetical protein